MVLQDIYINSKICSWWWKVHSWTLSGGILKLRSCLKTRHENVSSPTSAICGAVIDMLTQMMLMMTYLQRMMTMMETLTPDSLMMQDVLSSCNRSLSTTHLSPSYLHTYTQSLTINKHTHTMCVGKTKIFWPETSRVEISGVSMDCIWPGWVTPHSHLVASPQSGDISPANIHNTRSFIAPPGSTVHIDF